jgi:hypothetical protein
VDGNYRRKGVAEEKRPGRGPATVGVGRQRRTEGNQDKEDREYCRYLEALK